MMKKLLTVLTVLLAIGSGPLQATATLESFKFADEAAEQHFKDLIAELRCLVCQNQSLADSDAELAHDLRAEVYEMVQDGKSDAEVIEFLVQRYGDFVLYKPPMKPSTYLLWFGPFALMILAGVLLLRAVRRQKRTATTEISADDRKRLDDLLGDQGNGEQKS
ncbi:MAG TPA: cytochrome c-type biogenesis protein [Gammaproteobacteria bacterium]|nr:cytochrome c-type biogenesis protein [Gammaproteobacteria bacterium]